MLKEFMVRLGASLGVVAIGLSALSVVPAAAQEMAPDGVEAERSQEFSLEFEEDAQDDPLQGEVPNDSQNQGVSQLGLEDAVNEDSDVGEGQLQQTPVPQTDLNQEALETEELDGSSWDVETAWGGDPFVIDQTNHLADTGFEIVSRSVGAAVFDAQRAIQNWTPGFILSDRALYTPSLMSEAQIKTFIQAQGANCTSSSTTKCLKNMTTKKMALKSKFDGSGYGCKPLTLAAGTPAWTAVKAVGDACGINPQVLLVFIQKESSGLTSALSTARWDKMMGMGCPDGQPCKTEYAGFANQLYYGADALTSYRYRGFRFNEAVKTGKPIAVPYSSGNPTGCGSQSFVMQNQATASLYTYNPAVPSASALASYPGYTSNPCDSWGQRNVYMFMWKWFPETMQDHPGAQPKKFTATPKPRITGVPMVGATLRATNVSASGFSPTASVVTFQWFRAGAAIPGATRSTYTATTADQGRALSVKITGAKQYYTAASATSATVTVKGSFARFAGQDRYQTNQAVNASVMKAGKPLFVASGADFADALSVGPAVAASGGSLILTKRDRISAGALSLVKSKKPSNIYVIGGTDVVSQAVVSSLREATGVNPTRVAGANRYGTSAEILKTFFGSEPIPLAFVATGTDYPDALSAAAAGGALGAPVLLVNGETGKTDESAISVLKSKGTAKLLLVGGTAVISKTGAEDLSRAVPAATVERLSGANRYKTNMAVNDYLTAQGSAPSGVWLATGRGFADALSAAVPAASKTQRLVLAPTDCIPAKVLDTWILGAGAKVDKVTLVGGTAVLTNDILAGARCK